jgi:hypothetical protein
LIQISQELPGSIFLFICITGITVFFFIPFLVSVFHFGSDGLLFDPSEELQEITSILQDTDGYLKIK